MLKDKLVKLIQANPQLPVIMCVNSSVVCDDWYSWWLGSIDSVEVSKYCYDGENVWRYGDCIPNKKPEEIQWIDAIIIKVGLPRFKDKNENRKGG